MKPLEAVKRRTHRITLLGTMAVAIVSVMATQAQPAGIGFQAVLKNPPRVVSAYRENPDRFSAATYPLSRSVLSRFLLFKPVNDSASFDDQSLYFNTSIHGGSQLIPLSADAPGYMTYRLEETEKSKRGDLFVRNLRQLKQQNRRQGLSIGVNLPKRFDQIFGEGGGNLRVSGYRRITFSGRSQWTDGASTDAGNQSRFPSLNMEQISRFDITGTIGSKISVKVSQDSQTDIPLANRIQIRYKGDDDDILKVIEAGNTNLRLPNTRFVGYSSRIQGLFGLKAEAQLGNLRLIGIASQEKGSSEQASISASGEESAQIRRDYDYVEGRIYDLGYPGEFFPNDSIRVIYVYEQDIKDSLESLPAIMYVDPNDLNSSHDSMSVKLVNPDQYEIRNDASRNLHFIYFNTPRRDAVGVYMEIVHRPPLDTLWIETVGSIPSDSTLSLMYIQATRANYTPNHKSWSLMWRNCYRIPRGVTTEDVGINVLRALPGREGTTAAVDYQLVNGQSQGSYLTILGLDQENRQGARVPDDIVDELPLIFEPDWGLLIFPSRRPFDTDTTYQTSVGTSRPLAVKVPNIYDYFSPTQKTERSEYYIKITSKSRSSVIRLNRANIIEGSERVTLNGRILQRDVDYKIQYDFGQVTLLSDEATDPNADLKVEFEYAPFLAVQKKTLLGMRAEYEYSRDLKFGSTILYKSDKAQDRKPRVGQETARAMVLDFDAAFKLYPHFLTKAVNALPLVTTETPSVISVSGEIAQSRPNPNVEGVAYIDDFESSQDQLSIGVTRTVWTRASRPALDDFSGPSYQRGKLIWHQIPPVAWESVYDNERAAGEGTLRPLELVFRPSRFLLTWDSAAAKIDTGSATRSWSGIMRYFGNRIDAKRVQLFEVRARGTSGILHFDFGVINEDVDGDGGLDTEDLDRNNAVDPSEDIGLDGVADSAEVGRDGRPYDPAENPDPQNDDWWFEGDWPPPVPASRYSNQAFRDSVEDINNILHYEWINGTEGNRDDQLVVGIPDKEVLSSSGFELEDGYFSYHINLASDTFLVPGSENSLGWKTYRIPIREPDAVDSMVTNGVDSATWAQITHVRVWMEADTQQTEPTVIDIANWNFIQSNWQDTLLFDSANIQNGVDSSVFFVASVSEQDGTFSPPPDVVPYRDRQTNIAEAQRGLSLVYENLNPGDTGLVTRDLVTSESYSGYRRVEMYVNGPPTADTDSVVVLFRLGRDHDNYYEYQSTVYPGWDDRNFINMDFNIATALKDSALRARKKSTDPIDVTSGQYHVVGLPNINEIRFFGIGLVNTGSTPLTGRIWLDELRLTDVRNDIGTAVRLTMNGTMADLLNYSFSIEHRDAFFRGLSSATRGGSSNNLGSGSTSDNLSVSTTLQLHKFLPRSWNSRVPIGLSYSKATQTPLLRNNSDIILPPEVRKAEQSINETRRLTVSESFAKKGRNPLFSVLLNRQKTSFSYTRSQRSSVNNPFVFAENYNIRSEYDMSIRTDPTLPIFVWTKWIPIARKARDSRLHLFPKTWRWTATFNRSLSITEDKDRNRRSSFRRDLDGRMNLNYSMFDNLTMTLNYSTKRDLTDPDLIRLSLKNPKLGLETNYSQQYRANYDPKLLSFLSSQFSYSANYTDNWDRSTKTRNSNLQRSWSISGQFNHVTLLGGGGSTSRRFSGARRSNVRGGGASESKRKRKRKPFYDPPLAVLRRLTGWINPFSYKYSESYRNSVPALLVRPSLSYRFGIRDNPEVPRKSNTRNPASSQQVSYELGSGFKLLTGITTDVRYRQSINRDLVKTGGNRTERKSTSWPDLGIRISKFKTFPLIKKYVNGFINIFSPRTGYTRQVKEDMNLDGGFLTNSVETISRNPLLAINFRLFRSVSLSGSYSSSKTNTKRFNPTNGSIQSETRSNRNTLAASAKWSFSAPGGLWIPLFGRLKFRSQVTIDVTVKYASELAETAQSGGSFAVGTDRSDFSVQPVISYTFSQQIKGGLRGRWQDTNDAKSNRKNHTRELQIWAEMRF